MGRGYLRGAVGVCVAILSSACADEATAPAEQQSGVLGVQVDRDGDVTRTFEPTEAPAPTPPTDDRRPAPPTAEVPSGADADAEVPSDPSPPAAQAPPRARSGPTVGPTQHASPAPVTLASREGHSYVTWFRNEEEGEDGESRYVWGEVSVAPTVTRDGSEPLRVRLVDLAGEDDPGAPRRAQCPAWLEVDGDRPVRARGALAVEVVVDGEVVSSGVRDIDVTVDPGSRRDLVAIGDVRVTVPEVAEVTCRVRFEAAASD